MNPSGRKNRPDIFLFFLDLSDGIFHNSTILSKGGRRMLKKLIAAALVLLVLALGLAWGLHVRHENTYITIHGVEYRRDTEALTLDTLLPGHPAELTRLEKLRQLDLRAADVSREDYDALRSALPDCEILWSVPFRDARYPQDTAELTLSALTREEIAHLDYFPNLSTIHAEQCRDYDALLELITLRPDLEVFYTVSLGGRDYPGDTRELTLTDADPAELETAIPRLPLLERVTLEGTLPEARDLMGLWERYPDIAFYWQIEVFDRTADVNTTELDLSGIPMESVEAVEAAAAFLPNIRKVLMLDCGISDEQMHALNQRHEGVLFVWNVVFNQYITLRSDVEAFAPVQHKVVVWDGDLEKLKYCTELRVLDLGHMNLWSCDCLSGLSKLEYLIIADTHVRDITPLANLKNLKFLEMFMTRVTDYTPLLELTALEDLNMCYTVGDPAPIMEMTWLKRLWWCGSYMTQEQIGQLEEALPDTQIVFPKVGSTDDGWRKGQLYYEMRDLLGMPYLD